MVYATRNGSGSKRCFLVERAMSAVRLPTIGYLWRLYSTVIAPVFLGVIERIFHHLSAVHDNEYMMIDSTIVRGHQHSAGALKKNGLIRPLGDHAVD